MSTRIVRRKVLAMSENSKRIDTWRSYVLQRDPGTFQPHAQKMEGSWPVYICRPLFVRSLAQIQMIMSRIKFNCVCVCSRVIWPIRMSSFNLFGGNLLRQSLPAHHVYSKREIMIQIVNNLRRERNGQKCQCNLENEITAGSLDVVGQ